MAGLLDFFGTPAGQGLLAAGLGAAASSGRGRGLLGNLGQGGLLGLGAYSAAQGLQDKNAQEAQERQLRAITLERAQRDNANEKGLLGLQSQYFTPGQAANPGTAGLNIPPELSTGAIPMPATPATAPKFDVSGYTSAALSKGLMTPVQAAQLQTAMAKDTPINKLDVKDFTPASVQRFAQTKNYGDLVRLDKLHFADTGSAVTGLDPFTGQPRGAAVAKTGNPFSDLVVSDGQGGVKPNSPLVAVKRDIAKSGASNTSVKVENKMGEGLAAQVGPMMKDSVSAAEAAAKQIDAANRIISAVDSNKMIAGTGAEVRLTAAQVADTLGIGGEDNKTKIANTRQALQGLSQLTLQGRAQMRGQGAITESESKLAERATSGDISMTPGEIKQLAAAARRAANYMQTEHARKLEVIKANPALASMAPFYDVTPVPAQADPAQAPTATPKPTMRYENGKLVMVK